MFLSSHIRLGLPNTIGLEEKREAWRPTCR